MCGYARYRGVNFETKYRLSIFNENLFAIQLKQMSIVMNRPIYVGFCILDLSKITLYKFHYDYIKKFFSNNASLLYTDTDNLIYEFTCEDIYKHIKQDVEYFDTSDYP